MHLENNNLQPQNFLEEQTKEYEESPFKRHKYAHPKGGMQLHDEGNIINTAVKDILGKVANKIMKVEFTDILKMSSPAYIHCPNTYLDCAAMDFKGYSQYLNLASKTQDPIERIKLITAMFMGGQHISPEYCQMRAPLNPILGETLQRVCPDGARIYLEQTSHHPPITHFSLESANYRFSGYFEYKAWLAGLNTIGGTRVGKLVLSFNDGGLFSFKDPHVEITGLTYGDRTH